MNRAHIFGAFLALAVFLVGGGAAARPDRGTVLRATVVNGAGRVMTSDGRLNCRTRCSIRYPRGTIRRLTAKPAAHYLFTRWAGDCIGTAPNCDVALDRATSVRAGFVGEWSGVVISVGGPGRVTSAGGINCGGGSHVCSLRLALWDEGHADPASGQRRTIRRLGRTMRRSRNRSLHAACREPAIRDGGCVRAQLAAGGRPAADGDPPQLVSPRDESAGGDRLSAHVSSFFPVGDHRHTAHERRHLGGRMHG